MRQNEGERYHDHCLPEQGKENCLLRLAKACKDRLPGKLQGHKTESKEINPHSMNTCFHQLPAAVENGDKSPRHQHGKNPYHSGISYADRGHEFDSLLYSPIFSRPVIKTYDRLSTLGKPVDRDTQNFPHGVDDGHNPYIYIPAKALQGNIADDLYHTIGGLHDKS